MAIGLVRHSRRFYSYVGSDGGAVPWGVLIGMAGLGGLGAGVGRLAAHLMDSELGTGTYVGCIAALLVGMVILVGCSGVVFAAWILKIEDDDHPKAPPHARRAK